MTPTEIEAQQAHIRRHLRLHIVPNFMRLRKRTCLDLAALSKYIGTEYPALVDTLIDPCHSRESFPTRPTILIHDGLPTDLPDVWLLVWRRETQDKCEATEIHDHGKSMAGIYVYTGAIKEVIYATDRRVNNPRRIEVRSEQRIAGSGSTLMIGAPYIHTVEGLSREDFSVTIHSYYPPLIEMRIFRQLKPNFLTVTDHWIDDMKGRIK